MEKQGQLSEEATPPAPSEHRLQRRPTSSDPPRPPPPPLPSVKLQPSAPPPNLRAPLPSVLLLRHPRSALHLPPALRSAVRVLLARRARSASLKAAPRPLVNQQLRRPHLDSLQRPLLPSPNQYLRRLLSVSRRAGRLPLVNQQPPQPPPSDNLQLQPPLPLAKRRPRVQPLLSDSLRRRHSVSTARPPLINPPPPPLSASLHLPLGNQELLLRRRSVKQRLLQFQLLVNLTRRRLLLANRQVRHYPRSASLRRPHLPSAPILPQLLANRHQLLLRPLSETPAHRLRSVRTRRQRSAHHQRRPPSANRQQRV